jgi:periplasmic protein CpxP/Spy
MPYFSPSIAVRTPIIRSVAITALLGATFLATPLTATRALAQAAVTPAAASATETKGETVQQRIADLHASLKITPAEETQWNGVAQAMHENAAAMDKLVATNRTTLPQNLSAVQELQTYQQLAQAQVDGLENLTAAFSTLYNVMSDDQKKLADQVFQTSGTLAGSAPKTTVAKHHGYHRNWDSGYYGAAPVGYGSPYNNGYYGSPYYAPSVYGPGISISLPFVNIGIQ